METLLQAHPKTVHQAQAWPEKMTHQGSAVHTVCFCPENCDARRVTDQVRQAVFFAAIVFSYKNQTECLLRSSFFVKIDSVLALAAQQQVQ